MVDTGVELMEIEAGIRDEGGKIKTWRWRIALVEVEMEDRWGQAEER